MTGEEILQAIYRATQTSENRSMYPHLALDAPTATPVTPDMASRFMTLDGIYLIQMDHLKRKETA